MTRKRGLGKGLNALITDELEGKIIQDNKNIILKLPINQVEPNRKQPRKVFDEDALQELSESIIVHGIIQPIIVAKKKGYYEIIAGERRWRAAKVIKLKEIPVIVKDYSDEEVLEVSLIENIQRESLNPIEEALAYRRLIVEFGLRQDEVGEKVSKSRSAITNRLRLLNLDKKTQEMIMDEMISSGHAIALLSIEDTNIQYELANKIFDNKLSVRETESMVKEYLNPKKKKSISKEVILLDPVYKKIENQVKEIFGTKVSIRKKDKQSGKIEIDFYSKDDLDRILEIIQSIQ